ncbi:isopenicillin-N N-acyltransferase [Exophiala viscosa]|uniref:Protein transport protein BOS1 n=1 Tax=Exophiala viscosa TaxID=2486360 RepID=A0AAN6DS78_9EURO|nr:isopenicillin-N N-acyltransferase [Exophiala viscosa]KAI1623395.1 isopenicillin-N N-acyltransferase [Exophiala viscosa]
MTSRHIYSAEIPAVKGLGAQFSQVGRILILLSTSRMNALFNSALKQSTAVRRDLETFADAPAAASPALQGQISTTLTSFSRTLEDYQNLSRNEPNEEKKEKAVERLKNFRADLASYRTQFDQLKREREASVSANNRSELLGRRPHHAATPENPYAHASSQSAFAPAHRNAQEGLSFGGGPETFTREDHALREQNFFSTANAQLDEFLDRGRAVLGDLGQQREILKGTQKRLYSVANTLGVSGDTIRMVERRAKQDKWIFWAGVVVFFLFCWLVIHFLR